MSLIDKRSVFQILGNLMKKPSLLDEEKYKFTTEDFHSDGESSFYTIIYAAINNLYKQGIEELDLMMIDSFLSSYDVQYRIFNDNDGLEYLQNAIDQSHFRNFDYSYNRLKKFSLLRMYKNNGFDISELYDENIIVPRESEKMMAEFDELTIDKMIEHYDKKLVEIANQFSSNQETKTIHASDKAKELLAKFKKAPDYGISMIGKIQNTIFRGAKLKSLGLRSAPSNLGKTRIALGEATDMAIDEIYDLKKEEWVSNNNGENVLFISTEIEGDALQSTILAYISGVPEKKIKDGATNEDEDERLAKAIEILERSNYWIEYIPDFDTQLIENKIKQHIIENQAQYIYFDYLHISMSILEEIANSSKGMKLREDMVLFMFMNRLDQMRKRYNVYIQTATQVNGDWKHTENADSTVLRGSKAIADKATKGIIALTPTTKDLESIEPILRNGFYPEPNVVYHIYKNRETEYKDCKLWLYIDYDTMRQQELFLTKNNYELINIEPTEIKTEPKQTKYSF
ncbi:DnaB-like helicase C-terminal domain-containing protein [Metabacillus sp. Hm71]|uniref:DnaB-like helicase C-terminal domain-containing protein n=1 Tax=Metabacillus sp. Hm71 TaxID=3450743 RepID=UPI003F429FEA